MNAFHVAMTLIGRMHGLSKGPLRQAISGAVNVVKNNGSR